MSIFDVFTKKPAPVDPRIDQIIASVGRISERVSALTPTEPRTFIAQVERPVIDHEALKTVNLASMHWAMTPEGVGVVLGCSNGQAAVGLVNFNTGLAKVILNAKDQAENAKFTGPLDSIRRAYFDEIPVRGTEDPTTHEERYRYHGYIHSSEASK